MNSEGYNSMEYTNTGYTNQDSFDIQLKKLDQKKQTKERVVCNNFGNELFTTSQSIEEELEREKKVKIPRRFQRLLEKRKFDKVFDKIEKMGKRERTRDKPYIKNILLYILKDYANSYLLLKNFKKYEQHACALEILNKVAGKDTMYTIRYFKNYEHLGQEAEKILIRACKKTKPMIVIVNIQNIKNYKVLGSKYTEELVVKALKYLENKHAPFLRYMINKYEIFKEKSIYPFTITFLFKKEIGNYLGKHISTKTIEKILSNPKRLGAFLTYLKSYPITIGNQNINIENNMNFHFGILKTYFNNMEKYAQKPGDQILRNEVIADYERNIKAFINQGKKWSQSNKNNITSFIMRATKVKKKVIGKDGYVKDVPGTDWKGVIEPNNKEIENIYQTLSSRTILFNKERAEPPKEVIDTIETQITNDIEHSIQKYYIVHIAGHGSTDGDMEMAGGEWSKTHFNQLFNLQAKYPERVKIDITSCLSGYKDDNFHNNTIKNLSLDSGKHVSIAGGEGSEEVFIQAFQKKDEDGKFEADFDGDGEVNFNEALLYRAIHYQQSLTPIMFENEQGEVIDIVQTIPATQNNLSKDVARIA